MQIIHVLNRGVDKRKIFLNDKDYFRFVHDLFEFNDSQPVENNFYFIRGNESLKTKTIDVGRRYIRKEQRIRKTLVKIHAFCLMPNHYHLLLSPVVENGIALFMKKINGGYAKYFNEKYERTGALFSGKYKRILVQKDAHFIHLPYYIHLNPLDMIAPEWRKRELKNPKKAMEFLESYRWSSHLDYCGDRNFPSVTQRDMLLDFFGGHDKYKESINGWIEQLDMETIQDLILD